ncbi:F-box protein pof6 [Pleurostoma richardsiae]|uniref:F-box protein pof6 n=1 Tax=Pleurostoma richardsiae TaxID=41990 RepID=A0AA38RMH0_9PEZI|nr:F-box protein pof6 [Pleurostoma richardsiae]
MSNFKRAPPGVPTILSTLQATEMIDSKPVLPAEILVAILDYLPVSDQLRFARTSRRMREMVYDDTRWVARLKSMGCWNEAEARRRFEDALKQRRREAAERSAAATSAVGPELGRQVGSQRATGTTTLFDAAAEQERQRQLQEQQQQKQQQQRRSLGDGVVAMRDGFETMSIGAHAPAKDPFQDAEALLDVLKNAKSIRGQARQEYGKIYGALGPFYFDLVRARSHADPILFKVFRDPERQARMLSNLRIFAHSDWAAGWAQRAEKLASMAGVFEGAVLREFEQGYEFWDVDGRMRRYAHVLDLLGSGAAGVDLFVQKHPLFSDKEVLANSMDCLNQASGDGITLEPSREFFEILARKVNEQAGIIERIFPDPAKVFWAFVDKVREEVIVEYVTPLFDETHERNPESYLKAVSGLFEQCLQFLRALHAPKCSPEEKEEKIKGVALRVFEPHLDLYLQEELDFFTKHAEQEVQRWEKQLSEQEASVESFYMGSFNRQVDKKDFLSSFKKVVMMPVTVLPSLPGQLLTSPFGAAKPATQPSTPNGTGLHPMSPNPSRPQTPGLAPGHERKASPLPEKAPTDELAAKAALMASRLEGIKTLFSIEVALNLVHAAKTSLGRAAVFISLGGQAGEEAREQSAAIFVVLLRILGNGHIKPGFDRAVDHLSHYKARDVTDHSAEGVAPLVTFIELVNVGDLISQMIDVFYEQQLAGPRIADRNDFLDPAGLAKKKFEQMLDESVAAGLNKGIDVLMDEVEYICATTQLPTDYNPVAAAGETSGAGPAVADLGPTPTAQRVVELVRSHTSMLVGSTDKSMLDVFNGEVGLRLFTAVCKHLKRQRVSTEGAIKLIADMNLYFEYVRTLKNNDLLDYFKALRELSQIYLIDPRHAREMAVIIADGDRFGGIFRAEEVYEFAERRADWYQVKREVERAMYGLECCLM